jgi:hypothetical protein
MNAARLDGPENTPSPELIASRRAFFGFLIKRAIMGTVISLCIAGIMLWSDLGGVLSLMMRAQQGWLWVLFFCFDIWVTVTGITIAVGIWGLGEWRDPPG